VSEKIIPQITWTVPVRPPPGMAVPAGKVQRSVLTAARTDGYLSKRKLACGGQEWVLTARGEALGRAA